MALANAAYNLKQNDQAVKLYEQSLSLLPDSWPIRNELAEVYLEVGRPEAALQILEESLNITGNQTRSNAALFLQGQAYQQLGELENTAQSLERSLGLKLGGPPAERAYEILARVYTSLGLPRAIEGYEGIIRHNPQGAAVANINKGKFYRQVGQHEQALEVFTTIVDSTPSKYQGPAYLNRADARLEIRLFELAFGDFHKAFVTQTKWPYPSSQLEKARAFLGLGISLLRQGRHQLAIDYLDKAIELMPQSSKAHNLRGEAYSALGVHGSAVQEYDEAIRLDAQDVLAFHNRGKALSAQGLHQRAIEDYDAAIRLGLNPATVFVNRGKAYSEIGQYSLAYQDFDRAQDLEPNLLLAYGPDVTGSGSADGTFDFRVVRSEA